MNEFILDIGFMLILWCFIYESPEQRLPEKSLGSLTTLSRKDDFLKEKARLNLVRDFILDLGCLLNDLRKTI